MLRHFRTWGRDAQAARHFGLHVVEVEVEACRLDTDTAKRNVVACNVEPAVEVGCRKMNEDSAWGMSSSTISTSISSVWGYANVGVTALRYCVRSMH
jgi:hypothetical protein